MHCATLLAIHVAVFIIDTLDFVGVSTTLSIPSGSPVGFTECVDIEVFPDRAFEKDEVFSVHISSERNVNISMPYTSVTIVNDDSKSIPLTKKLPF